MDVDDCANGARYQVGRGLADGNRLSCPVILFQGLEDKVVLPNQAERPLMR